MFNTEASVMSVRNMAFGVISVLLILSASEAGAICRDSNSVICAADCIDHPVWGGECATQIGTLETTACYVVSPTTGCFENQNDCHCEGGDGGLF
jgi:hypothetical protein